MVDIVHLDRANGNVTKIDVGRSVEGNGEDKVSGVGTIGLGDYLDVLNTLCTRECESLGSVNNSEVDTFLCGAVLDGVADALVEPGY